jgi:copper transport protein
MMSVPRRGSNLAIAGVLVVVLLAIVPSSALAHAYFQASSPAPGKRVEHSPRRVTLEFSESLNQSLTKATIVSLATGKAVASEVLPSSGREVILKPSAPLPTAAYRVDWFSVSADDGHALAGQFSFGVRTKAIGGTQAVEEGPLARGGWWRIALRAAFYAALFFFAGGLMGAALLSGRKGRGSWLVPPGRLRVALRASGDDPEQIAARAWSRTVEVGWLAAALAAVLAIAEAANAASGLSLSGLNDYLLTNTAGIARVVIVFLLALAALGAWRAPRLAALSAAGAFLALAFAGHANSAHPHAAALLTDWLHLLAAAVWLGGIAQLALTWTGPLIRQAGLGRVVMGEVLDRFGRIALPAFGVVVITGLLNALIELGRPAELWQSAYGRVLAVKMGLVAVVAVVSYFHALRLRPRLAAANPHPDPKLERRHWLLLRREPLVGLAVLAAAALLVAFPLPPRQAGAAPVQSLAACSPSCPLPAAKDDQLPVADHLGPAIVAAWLRPEPGGLSGRLRLLGENLKALPGPPTIPGAHLGECGAGCWTFELRGNPASFEVSAPIEGHTYTARLPSRWISGARANQRARRLLASAQETMNRLRSAREHERITSGPGSLAVTDYELRAPNRMAYRTLLGGRAIVIGKREWTRTAAGRPWRLGHFGGGGPPFQTLTWFAWTPYAESVRLLGITLEGRHRFGEVALYEPGAPVWWRLRIDLSSMRVTSSHLITQGHFMTQRYYDFNGPVRISPPQKAPHGG